MGFSRWSRVVGLLVMAMCCSQILQADVVKEVTANGTLVLDNGKQVVLAGVRLDAEGVSVLKVLAQRQDLKIRQDTSITSENGSPAYAYIRAKFLKLPFKVNTASDEEEVMLNEFLISQGAARVVEEQRFTEKDHFLKIQEQAKKKGEGIWSYENY